MLLVFIPEDAELVNNIIDRYELKQLIRDVKSVTKSIHIYLKTLNKLLATKLNKLDKKCIFDKVKDFICELKNSMIPIIYGYSNSILAIYAFKICRLREILWNKNKNKYKNKKQVNISKKIKMIQLLMA
jgi:hypothetical protein